MATSGTYSWSLNRDQAILLALQLTNIAGENDTISDVSTAKQLIAKNLLNGMLKVWATDGIKTSKRYKAYLFPQLEQHQYALGSISGSDNCTRAYKSTELTSAASSGATTLVVTSTTGMTASDKIGIELDDGTRQWTTISSVNGATGLTIGAALTDDAAIDNTVVTYTTKINRPLDILYGTNLDITTNLESSIACIAHDQYNKLPVKTTVGRPNNIFYDKPLSGANPYTSNLYVFPQPQDVNEIITFMYVDSIQDMSSSTDDFDLPTEWQFPVVFNLGCEMARFWGKFEELARLEPRAKELYELLKAASSDNTDIQFSVGDGC